MTVIQSQIAMPALKLGASSLPPELARPTNGSAIAMAVVSAAPTSTTNMTGLRHMRRGSSLRSAPGSAATTCATENAGARAGVETVVMIRVLPRGVPVRAPGSR